jgi:AraC-like DNA-binding protein
MILIRIGFVYFYSTINSSDLAHLYIKYNSIEEIFSLVVSLIVFSYCFHILSKKEKLFTKILSFDNLKWIYTFFKLGLLSYVIWIISLTVTVAIDFKEIIYTYFPLRVLTTVLIYWLGYQAILQLKLLKERKKLRKKLNFPAVETQEITNEEEKNDYQKVLFDKINTRLNDKKLYTASILNLETLANETDISPKNISSVIYQFSNKNFNDYINEFRVQLAKELLVDTEYKNYTITSIGLESGFNSKSTFYSTFKKHTGKTPAEYQKFPI